MFFRTTILQNTSSHKEAYVDPLTIADNPETANITIAIFADNTALLNSHIDLVVVGHNPQLQLNTLG